MATFLGCALLAVFAGCVLPEATGVAAGALFLACLGFFAFAFTAVRTFRAVCKPSRSAVRMRRSRLKRVSPPLGVPPFFGLALGLGLGVSFDLAFGVTLGVALGAALAVALGAGLVLGVALGVGLALGLALGAAFGVASSFDFFLEIFPFSVSGFWDSSFWSTNSLN